MGSNYRSSFGHALTRIWRALSLSKALCCRKQGSASPLSESFECHQVHMEHLRRAISHPLQNLQFLEGRFKAAKGGEQAILVNLLLFYIPYHDLLLSARMADLVLPMKIQLPPRTYVLSYEDLCCREMLYILMLRPLIDKVCPTVYIGFCKRLHV